MQHGDAFGDLPHERHVVLDHDQRVLAFEAVDDLRGFVGFSLGHAGGRLVEQNHLWILRDQEAQFEPLGLTVAEIGGQPIGLRSQADQFKHAVDIVSLLAESETEIGQHRGITATGDFEIAAYGQILEDAGI